MVAKVKLQAREELKGLEAVALAAFPAPFLSIFSAAEHCAERIRLQSVRE